MIEIIFTIALIILSESIQYSSVRKEKIEAKNIADDAKRDLDKAMPALEAANDALEKLDKKYPFTCQVDSTGIK